jgi:hypothetical protein
MFIRSQCCLCPPLSYFQRTERFSFNLKKIQTLLFPSAGQLTFCPTCWAGFVSRIHVFPLASRTRREDNPTALGEYHTPPSHVTSWNPVRATVLESGRSVIQIPCQVFTTHIPLFLKLTRVVRRVQMWWWQRRGEMANREKQSRTYHITHYR